MSVKYPSIPADAGTYSNIIGELCLNKGMTISDLARVINIANATAYDICRGKRLPSFITERKLEKLFELPIHEMYDKPYDNLVINWNLVPKVE